jgi:hypothetical protein
MAKNEEILILGYGEPEYKVKWQFCPNDIEKTNQKYVIK